MIKIIPKKKKCKKTKWLSEKALQIAEKRRDVKGKREKERYTHLNAGFQRIARRDKKVFLSDQCKEREKNNRMEKTIDTKGTFDAKRKWSRSVVSNSLRPHGLQPTRLLCPWDFPGTSTGVGCHFLLQGIFLTQESNPGLPHCRQTLYHLSHQGMYAKMGTIKERNSMGLTKEEDIQKRWQEYTEELYKKDLHDPDNYSGVITHLELDILECKVK